ncbi:MULTISPECIES: hypothetical protein [Cupriavidus]|uniref:Uncharacterized protein n=1 Tax=Cupriavidus pinatubonensis (strain JMP 134 / LMG 1197) TaxID=264198 RepID=Q471C8_CUPPJ|nr:MULTISPECIES: hypothetical protein [Cupriavidus]QYY33181.1 hypothetical protein K2O51_20925 [Cupriavidus pinatubonensis]TPQ36994.1 hypothetical protein C2U69_17305 [Cupriavidus pinatubonensis]
MKKIQTLTLMAMAVLATAGTAHAQRAVGGMGEEIRIGAFSEPGHASRNRGFTADSRDGKAVQGRTPTTVGQQPRRAGARAPAVPLPGRHLP